MEGSQTFNKKRMGYLVLKMVNPSIYRGGGGLMSVGELFKQFNDKGQMYVNSSGSIGPNVPDIYHNLFSHNSRR